MKALSLWQPWATLMAYGLKRVETRSWAIRHRGPLLIHAAKKWTPDLGEIAADPLFFRPALQQCGVKFEATLRRQQREIACAEYALNAVVDWLRDLDPIPDGAARLLVRVDMALAALAPARPAGGGEG